MLKSIMGYSDKFSVYPGEKIEFKVSDANQKTFKAELVRIIHGDTSPEGPGYKDEKIQCDFEGSYEGKFQPINAGSYCYIPNNGKCNQLDSMTLQANIWPTTPEKGLQIIVSMEESDSPRYILGINEESKLFFGKVDGESIHEIVTGAKVLSREWYFVSVSYSSKKNEITLTQLPQTDYALTKHSANVNAEVKEAITVKSPNFVFAAKSTVGKKDCFYNGKIDSVRISQVALELSDSIRLNSNKMPSSLISDLIGAWDFSVEMHSQNIHDISPNRMDGFTVQMPARAMKGYNWTGDELNWRYAPDQYGAIHFHDDDLYDAGWSTDFQFVIPEKLKSGWYAAHLTTENDEDFIPFVVKARPANRKAKAVFCVPIASYLAYANEHMMTDAPLAEHLTDQVVTMNNTDVFLHEHREYGASMYDSHSDGSGVCYSSRLRPILTMRPKYQSWLGGKGSSLWQMNADTHITDWLETKKFDYECISDEDLHYEGVNALEGYDVFLTSTHHEYWSKEMWDALDAFKKRGGRIMYLGANAFYWRVAFNTDLPGVMEVRRGEGGIRAWAAEPGEYYHSFTGEYGGLWRRSGRPPQMMAGTGFSAQGFDVASYFRKTPESNNERSKFIFEGVSEEIIGDFGLIGDGAAGLELDRADPLLGTPPNTLVLASSEEHSQVYMVVLEEIFINAPGMCGGEHPLVRADMVFFETPAGGAVFSTSSISWAGSLSHNNYENNVSKITENVLRRFLKPEKFEV